VKSIISNTEYGDTLKKIRDKGLDHEMESLYLIDLLFDELRIGRLLKQRDVVRDKTYTSSIAHLRAHGCVNNDKDIKKAMLDGYHKLESESMDPDLLVFLKRNREDIVQHAINKLDKSSWDEVLFEDKEKFDSQSRELAKEIESKYAGKILVISDFTMTIEETCEYIMGYIRKR
jgi:tRNA G37 N-methylase Trm5